MPAATPPLDLEAQIADLAGQVGALQAMVGAQMAARRSAQIVAGLMINGLLGVAILAAVLLSAWGIGRRLDTVKQETHGFGEAVASQLKALREAGVQAPVTDRGAAR